MDQHKYLFFFMSLIQFNLSFQVVRSWVKKPLFYCKVFDAASYLPIFEQVGFKVTKIIMGPWLYVVVLECVMAFFVWKVNLVFVFAEKRSFDDDFSIRFVVFCGKASFYGAEEETRRMDSISSLSYKLSHSFTVVRYKGCHYIRTVEQGIADRISQAYVQSWMIVRVAASGKVVGICYGHSQRNLRRFRAKVVLAKRMANRRLVGQHLLVSGGFQDGRRFLQFHLRS